jgi:hypothetical protein
VSLLTGAIAAKVSPELGITEQTYYRSNEKRIEGRAEQVKSLRELEGKNMKLKKFVVELPLDNAILKEAV